MNGPRVPRLLVERLIAPHLHDCILGDLDELYARNRARHRRFYAWGRYWIRTAQILAHLGGRRGRLRRGGDSMLGSFLRDLWLGTRVFGSHPGYAVAAVLTLALAMGANTLIFTMANVVVLKPLPFAGADRLAWVFVNSPEDTSWRGPMSLPEYAAYRDQTTTIEHLSAWQRRVVTLSGERAAERAVAHVVVGDLQRLWGLRARIGRTLSAGDERAAAPPVAVLSHRYWVTRFGGRPDVVGMTQRIDGEYHTIAGVLTPDIELGTFSEIDIWIPFRGDAALGTWTDRSWRAVGRLADGVTFEQAHAQVAAIGHTLVETRPELPRGSIARVGSTRDALGAPNVWVVLSLLVAVVGFLLLLACANVMNLLIARLIGRRAELAVRTALGATRWRLVRQIVAEGLAIGLAGGALALAVARGGLAAVHAVSYEPFFRQLTFDWRVLTFAVLVAVVSPLVFGVAPTLAILRGDVRSALTDASARSVGGRSATRAQAALVVVQVTLAVSLLAFSALVVQSVANITRIDPGYAVDGLLTTHLEVPEWKVAADADVVRVRQAVTDRIAGIARARGVTVVSELPGLETARPVAFAIASRTGAERDTLPAAGVTITTPSYFDVLQVPIVAGRGFASSDAASAAPVAVIEAEAARRYFGNWSEAIGQQITIPADSGVTATIIGVARDIAMPSPGSERPPQIYLLDAHRPTRRFHVVVRAERPEALAEEVRAAIYAVDADLPPYQMRTVVEAFVDERSSDRLIAGLFAAFAVVAVLLATAGLYAVMAYGVSRRRHEIAVRMAIGASARRIATLVVGRSLMLAAVGTGLGLALAFVLAQPVRSILFGVGPADPMTYAGVAALSIVAAFAAAYGPTRRALAVDAATGLRHG